MDANISVTPKAVEAIARQMKKRGTMDASLRLGIRGGGCSGFSYVIEFHDGTPRAKSLLYLGGTELEWEQTLMQQGFKFKNPHEKTGCGCGHSFSV